MLFLCCNFFIIVDMPKFNKWEKRDYDDNDDYDDADCDGEQHL